MARDFHQGSGTPAKQIVFSVKAGHVTAAHVRERRGVLEREDAAIAVLLSMDDPTAAMRTEAVRAGFCTSPWGKHARLQILTVENLLAGHGIDRPPVSVTFKKDPRAKGPTATTRPLDFIGAAAPDEDE